MKFCQRIRDKRKEVPLYRIYLLFLVMALFLGFFRSLGNVDELWNFTFGNNIARGLVPYRDFNLLQTPLFAMFDGLFLRILGRELLVTRGLGALLFAGICLLLYLFSGSMGAEGALRGVLPMAFLLCFMDNVFFEYSCTILFVQLLCMYGDCRNFREDRQERYFTPGVQLGYGVMAGIGIMCKQTFGGFVALAAWISLVLVCRYRHREKKETLRLLFFRLLGSSVPCFFVLFYLLGTGSWDDFLEMSVQGISTFSSHLSLWSFMTEKREYFVNGVIFLVIIALSLFYTWHYRRKEEGHLGVVVLLYSVLGCINLYPLCNSYHIQTCLFPFAVLTVPYLALLQKKIRLTGPVVAAALVACALYICLWIPRETLNSCRLLLDVPHFYGIFMEKDEVEEYYAVLQEVYDRRDNGFEVYILANEAPQYLIPADIYHKYMDMFLVGNLGTKTPKDCLEDSLQTSLQSIYLLPHSFSGQYQYPRSAVESFREEELDSAGNVGTFDCYVPKV